jgi:chromosome segregation ATPase
MESGKTLFDGEGFGPQSAGEAGNGSFTIQREVLPLDRLKNLEQKITGAVERVKALKEEKTLLERKIRDLESLLDEKNQEIETLKSEKSSIGSQLEELLNELETIEI